MTSSNGTNSTDSTKNDPTKNASLGELFSRLANDTSTLVRQEVALARAEVSQKVGQIAKSAIMLVLAATLAMFALLTLLAAGVIYLGNALDNYGAAALIIGGALLLLAVIFALVGIKKLKSGSLAPTQTLETLKEDAQWLKEQVKS